MTLDPSKDPNRYFRAKLGGGQAALRLLLSPKPVASANAGNQASEIQSDNQSRVRSYRRTPDELVLKKKQSDISFYDLGTRLLSTPSGFVDFVTGYRDLDDNTPIDPAQYLQYTELLFDGEGSITGHLTGVGVPEGDKDPYTFNHIQHAQVQMDDPTIFAAWDAAILGTGNLDPFTDITAPTRKMPMCLPIWYGLDTQPSTEAGYTQSQGYCNEIFDLVIGSTVYPNTKYREIVADIRNWIRNFSNTIFQQSVWDAMTRLANTLWDGLDDYNTATENWNPLTLAQDGISLRKRGHLKFVASIPTGDVKLNTRLIYEPFDTGDTTNYKVTTGPTFASDEVPFSVGGKDKVKVYLKPQYLAWARKYIYTYSKSLTYSSYRGRAGSVGGATWYNRQQSVEMVANSLMVVTFNSWMDVGLGQDPDAGPFTWNMIIDADADTQTGTVVMQDGSTTSFTATLLAGTLYQAFVYGPNWRVQIVLDSNHGFSSHLYHSESDVTPAYSNTLTSASVTATVMRGVHVGRWPVFPRPLNTNGWRSMLVENGTTSFVSDFSDGSTKTYDPTVAKDMVGRLDVPTFGSVDTKIIYERQPSRDRNDFLMHSQGAFLVVQDVTGQSSHREVGGSVTTDDQEVVGSGPSVWDAEGATALATLRTNLLAVSHIGTVTLGSAVSTLSDSPKSIAVLPVNAPIGLLAGVIVKNGTKYYIWRKTADVRQGKYDYERSQGRIAYGGTMT